MTDSGSELFTYQLAPFIDTDGNTYLTMVVNGEIKTKRRVEEFWIRQITTRGRADGGRY